MKKKEKSVYQKAIDVFGVPFQRNRMIEECAELVQAIAKVIRNEDDIARQENPIKKEILRKKTKRIIHHFVQEIVDVEVVLTQMKLIIPKDIYQLEKSIRLNRLEKNIKKEIYDNSITKKSKLKSKSIKKKGNSIRNGIINSLKRKKKLNENSIRKMMIKKIQIDSGNPNSKTIINSAKRSKALKNHLKNGLPLKTFKK